LSDFGGKVNKRLFHALFLVILVAMGGHCPVGYSAALIQDLPSGQMDWTNGTLTATGIAQPSGKKSVNPVDPQKLLSSAKVTAQQNLLLSVKQLRVSSIARVETLAGSNPLFMAKIQELIKKAPVINQSYLSDGTVTITLKFSLTGAFYQWVMPPGVEQIDPVKPVNTSSTADKETPDESRWTGLIVDAAGLVLNPAMVPQIVDERGNRIYGPAFISRDFAVGWGGCGYMADMDRSAMHRRIGSHPLVVRGIGVNGPEQTNIVISTVDASRIRAAAEHVSLMREGRVIVLIDEWTKERTN
jgi:hypothetical protein